ncbi:5,6-dimethylbenzimidazole synthase [Halodurantibacterium flavum]|uniref:5,6-dimethylbenzimidazole synthase n=1 Tax=Halodurantibacterium flavum TaxID=1382802 RepID=A0ABW4S6R6_9RHOB
MKFTPDDLRVLRDILRWRRDVRHFRADPVPPEVLAGLEAAMTLAPSVGNARPWRVMRVRDAARRAEIIRIFEGCNQRAARDYDAATRADYLQLKLAGLREAPEHLAVFTLADPDEGRGLGRQTMPETLRLSTAMAIHTLWLAARAENLGLGWVSILDPAAVAQALSAPRGWEFTAYLCLGYPEFTDDTPLLHRNGWQENRNPGWIDCPPHAKGP